MTEDEIIAEIHRKNQEALEDLYGGPALGRLIASLDRVDEDYCVTAKYWLEEERK